jgi:hypothetical protein
MTASDAGKVDVQHLCKLAEAHIFPQWDGWTLVEMSESPRAVKTWYTDLSKSVHTSAKLMIR